MKHIYFLIYLLKIHLTALALLSALRIIHLINQHHLLNTEHGLQSSALLQAILNGLRFDNMVGCYILLIPALICAVLAICNYYHRSLFKIINIFFILSYMIVLGLSAANIPYFGYFFKNINPSILNWNEYGNTTIAMIIQETSYYLSAFFFLITVIVLTAGILLSGKWLRKKMKNETLQSTGKKQKIASGLCSILFMGLCIIGIRGGLGRSPLRINDAYNCNDLFLDQVGVNPAFNFLKCYMNAQKKENQTLQLMDEQKAIYLARKYLSVTDSVSQSPIARKIIASQPAKPYNVILVFMESMSASYLRRHGNKDNLTPYLDELSEKSITFDYFFSAGHHTNQGIYSTLCSYPSILSRNAISSDALVAYQGFSSILKENGYQTLFFMPHEKTYDNLNSFLSNNGYNEIYSKENYPSEAIVNCWGVPDEFLYNYAISTLKNKKNEKQPFFATILTVSNHPPYTIPADFHPTSEKEEEKTVEYADYSIRNFMKEAERQPWYANTIFVFVGDHGKLIGQTDTDIPISYNHIPLIIYSKKLKAESHDSPGGQIDIGPTILGLLNISYTRNSLGVDLLKNKRPCMYFTSDDMIGCLNKEHFFIYSTISKKETLYKKKGGQFYIQHNGESTQDSLKEYGFSMLQTTEYMIKNEKTNIK